jgi:hypothetical protein
MRVERASTFTAPRCAAGFAPTSDMSPSSSARSPTASAAPRRIRQRLGPSPRLVDHFPPKPSRMRRTTYEERPSRAGSPTCWGRDDDRVPFTWRVGRQGCLMRRLDRQAATARSRPRRRRKRREG